MTKLFIVGISAALAACSGGGGTSDPDAAVEESADAAVDATPPPMGLEALCQENGAYAQIFEKISTCVNATSVSVPDALGEGLLSGSLISSLCDSQFRDFVEDGTIVIDDTKIQDCIGYVAATSCPELSLGQLGNTPCGQIFQGTVALAGDCDIDGQCMGDAYCQPGDTCGTCTARLENASDCTANRQCQSQNCNEGLKCAAPSGLDGACTGDADCLETLRCDGASTCQTFFLDIGDACASDDECGFLYLPAYCKLPAVSIFGVIAPGICTALPTPGEDCIEYADAPGGQLCNFLEYQWCDFYTLKCQEPTVSGLDGPCHVFAAVGSGARKCEAGLMCSDPAGLVSNTEPGLGTCMAPGLPGDECTVTLDQGFLQAPSTCHPLLECDAETLQCATNSEHSAICPAVP